MKIPASEVDWQKLLDTPRGVRSVFSETDVVSMYVEVDKSIQCVFYRAPYKEVPLKPFVTSRPLHGRANVYVTLEALNPRDLSLMSASYPVLWRSVYYRKSDDKLHFVYRPHAVWLLVPAPDGSSQKVGLVPYDPAAYLKARRHLVDLADLTRSRNAAVRSGFGGEGATVNPYPVTKLHEYVDQTYNNGILVSEGFSTTVESYHNVTHNPTPGFGLIPRRQLPSNAWVATIVKTEDLPSYDLFDFDHIAANTHKYVGSSEYLFHPLPDLSFDSNLRNKAITKLEERSHASISANLAQDIFQFGQLKRLVATTGRRLVDSITKLDSKDYVGALKALGLYKDSDVRRYQKSYSHTKTTAQNWLELQYAWKPLLKDIDGLISLLRQIVTDNPPVLSVRSRSRLSKDRQVFYGPFISGTDKVPLNVIERQSVKIVLKYSIYDELKVYLNQLGLTNGVNLAYEVLPFSFVADWFLPIGPYLESLTAWQGMRFIGGTITSSVKQNVSSSFEVSKSDGTATRTIGGAYSSMRMVCNREVLTDFPAKDLPRPKNPVSLTHALNAIALVVTGFKDPRRLK